jgi:PAS domain S-box-containing protein
MAGDNTAGARHLDRPRPTALDLLILEDSALDAELNVAQLEEAGYTCCWKRVETREDFVAQLAVAHDLILADYALPAFDGLAALEIVRDQALDIPFILVSGTLGEERAIEALKAGATDYVLKTRIGRLAPVVARALEEQAEKRQRRQAEAARRESEERYRTLTEVSPVGIFHADGDGHYLYVNERWCELAGVTAAAARGDGWLQAVHPDDRQRVQIDWRHAVAASQPFRSEFRFQHPTGVTIWVFGQVMGEDSTIGGARGYIGAVTNITDRKRAEEQTKQLNAELERRVHERTRQLEDTNRELESFSYSVSHDLRAPLRHIIGFSAELREERAADVSPHVHELLQRIGAAAQRMSQLIDDLLQLSRVTRAEMQRQRVDLSALAQSIGAKLQEGDPGRSVERVVAPDVVAYGDARLLRIVLENLLGNAWKYTATHPHARIEFGVTEGEAPVYFVRDDGVGFDMRYAEKLFGAFQRLHSSDAFEGTGIGLATVQRIIRRHGGRVWAEAAVEQGATFYFTVESDS